MLPLSSPVILTRVIFQKRGSTIYVVPGPRRRTCPKSTQTPSLPDGVKIAPADIDLHRVVAMAIPGCPERSEGGDQLPSDGMPARCTRTPCSVDSIRSCRITITDVLRLLPNVFHWLGVSWRGAIIIKRRTRHGDRHAPRSVLRLLWRRWEIAYGWERGLCVRFCFSTHSHDNSSIMEYISSYS